MPTYEYRCDNGHPFERVQKMTDKPVVKCPVCGAKAARVISGGQGVIFKGSGFYITDYGKDGKGPRKDPSAPAPTESKGESKTESASEPKAESKSDPKSVPSRDAGAAKESAPSRDAKPGAKPAKPDAS